MPDLIMCGFFPGQRGIGVKENGPDMQIRPGKYFRSGNRIFRRTGSRVFRQGSCQTGFCRNPDYSGFYENALT